jgi:hypothetical protein
LTGEQEQGHAMADIRIHMADIRIHPAISVWDGRRWVPINRGSKLLDLLQVILDEVPDPETDAPDGGVLFDRSVYEEREAFHVLMDTIDAEMARPAEELSRETTAAARTVIGRRRKVFDGVLS